MTSTLFYLWVSLLFLFSFAVDIDMEGLPDTGLDTTDWVDGQTPPLDDMWSLNDMQIAAKNVITARYYGDLLRRPCV